MAINLYSKASVDSLLSAKLSISSLSNAAATTLNATAPTTGQALTFDGTELKWATVSGGGGLTISTLSNGATSTLDSAVPTTGQALTYDGTNLKWATVGGSSWLGSRVSIYGGYLYNEDTSTYVSSLTLTGASTVNAQNLTLQASGGGVLTFADSTTQATKGLIPANNLSDLASASTARTNLGLGTAAVESASRLIPTGGTTGQVLSKIDGTNYNVTWTTAGGSGSGGIDIQTFSTAGTTSWTKPSGAKYVVGYMWGAGGGGGSGARNATSGIRSGGSAGAGGGLLKFVVDASTLSATETVVIGAGGLGAAARTADNSPGVNPSTFAGTTSFAGRFQVTGGASGTGGSISGTVSGGTGSNASFEGISLTSSQNAGGIGSTSIGGNASIGSGYYYWSSGGGGGAGQVAASVVDRSGGNGASKQVASGAGIPGLVSVIAGGAGGTIAGVAAGNGTNGSITYGGGTGGGGGAYRTGQPGGAGGNGVWGSGGGGGGASDNGFNSGAGGNGGPGALILITILG